MHTLTPACTVAALHIPHADEGTVTSAPFLRGHEGTVARRRLLYKGAGKVAQRGIRAVPCACPAHHPGPLDRTLSGRTSTRS